MTTRSTRGKFRISDEYTKDPPPLPPHLRHIILNKAPPRGSERSARAPACRAESFVLHGHQGRHDGAGRDSSL